MRVLLQRPGAAGGDDSGERKRWRAGTVFFPPILLTNSLGERLTDATSGGPPPAFGAGPEAPPLGL